MKLRKLKDKPEIYTVMFWIDIVIKKKFEIPDVTMF